MVVEPFVSLTLSVKSALVDLKRFRLFSILSAPGSLDVWAGEFLFLLRRPRILFFVLRELRYDPVLLVVSEHSGITFAWCSKSPSKRSYFIFVVSSKRWRRPFNLLLGKDFPTIFFCFDLEAFLIGATVIWLKALETGYNSDDVGVSAYEVKDGVLST